MTKARKAPTFSQSAFGLRADNPVARLMAGFTGFAVAVTLILATAIPVEAHRNACDMPGYGANGCAQ